MIKQLLPCLFAGLLLITSCQPDSDPIPRSEQTCRIIDLQTVTLTSNGSRDTTTSNYEYNSQGELVKINSVYSGGSIAHTTYTYNSEGFLTEQKTVTEGTNASLYVITYIYAQGKLSKTNTSYESAMSQYTNEYNYNTDGKITYFVWKGKGLATDGSTKSYKDSVVSQYTNGKLTASIEYRERESFPSSITQYTIETDARGLIISKYQNNSSKDIYQYNADGELVKQEHHYNNQLDSYWITEYDNKKNIADMLSPILKGRPANLYRESIHNMTKRIYYKTTYPTNTLEENSSNIYEYEYNDQGYPTKKIQKYTFNGQTTLTTTTYNIACQ